MATRERTNEGPGWFATLLGAGLLVVAGFGVGLVAGTAFEEPELVMDHLAGNGTEVPLEPAPVAAAPPDDTAAALDRSPASEPAPLDPPRDAFGDYAIQVGAFDSENAARVLAGELRDVGLPSYVARDADGSRFKVRVGPYETRDDAASVAKRLKTERRLPTWVLSEGG